MIGCITVEPEVWLTSPDDRRRLSIDRGFQHFTSQDLMEADEDKAHDPKNREEMPVWDNSKPPTSLAPG
jgi:hypothetical protein